VHLTWLIRYYSEANNVYDMNHTILKMDAVHVRTAVFIKYVAALS